METRKISLNFMASLVALLINMGIGFFLSPYIIKTVGAEAYGYILLASNFISYITIITTALTSMANRYIAISMHTNDLVAANEYMSSAFFANLATITVLIPLMIFVAIYCDRLVNIPSGIIWDVKLLAFFVFLSFLLGLYTSTFAVSYFIRNMLYIASKRQVEGSILRTIILVSLFALFPSKVWYIGVTTLVVTIYGSVFDYYYKRKLIPELQIKRLHFKINKVWELIRSGVWNTINMLGQVLLTGLDLLMANLFIDSVTMGVLAIAKTIPNIIATLSSTMAKSFVPYMTKMYASGENKAVLSTVNMSMKIMAMIISIPLIWLMVFGLNFFRLWVPNQDAQKLQILSLMTCGSLLFEAPISSLWIVFTITNKLRFNSIMVIITGICNALVVFAMLKNTDYGVYAIAGVSTVLTTIKNLAFVVPYAAKCLGVKSYVLFPVFIRSFISCCVATIICCAISYIVKTDTWVMLLFSGMVTALISIIINAMILFKGDERSIMKEKITKVVNNVMT